MALVNSVVDMGPNNDSAQVQNDDRKVVDLLRASVQNGTSSIKTGGIQLGTTTTTAAYMGGGTSAAPLVNSSTSVNSMEFRFDHSGATGDIRAMYIRGYYSGGCGGETIRAFSTMQTTVGTAHGAHISLNYDTSGATTGLACAIRGTLHIANRATSVGTAAAIQAEVYCDGTSSAATGTLSLLRCIVDGGDATARNTVDFFLTGVNLGTNIFTTKTSAAVTHWLKCDINGTTYYLMLSDTA